jgi:hypothetical protein
MDVIQKKKSVKFLLQNKLLIPFFVSLLSRLRKNVNNYRTMKLPAAGQSLNYFCCLKSVGKRMLEIS